MPPFGKEFYDDVVDRMIFVDPCSTTQTSHSNEMINVDTSSTESEKSTVLQEEKENEEPLPPPTPFVNRFLSFNPFETAGVKVNCNSLTPTVLDIPNPSPSISKVRSCFECGQGGSDLDAVIKETVVFEEQKEEGEEVNLNYFVTANKCNHRDLSKRFEWKIEHPKSNVAVVHDLSEHVQASEESSTAGVSKPSAERQATESKEANGVAVTASKGTTERNAREANQTETVTPTASEQTTKPQEAVGTRRLLQDSTVDADVDPTLKTKKKKFGVLKRTMKKALSIESSSSSTRRVPRDAMQPIVTQGQKKSSYKKKNFPKIDDHNYDDNHISSTKRMTKYNARKKNLKSTSKEWTKNILPAGKQGDPISDSYVSYQMVKQVAVIWS
mmetsp:Transcript_16513/g.37956  ORF Transcript_16513/g.37956 Transcript_16513/m.37956 type:complete len:385 (+) Transcript_16513:153-1307(+)|eukprot:CAMPEP_0172395092 /NCGR_PEP_ID=MMETSP1061-20121228/18080_1 /TAXON_ID=37318 /ORGANISM="Pseudo-nitzschia pungens, Strain cf. pungens" /LENGTH=384 /DNA_ID=CAMNT_0013126577 /DNA_START=90 /DNA_END=1244 /DNA_ORIENTATION=+